MLYKTDWKAGDKITATKLNKIEDAIEAVNNNDISRHEETDARLDALEAGRVADKQEINAKVEALEDTVVSNKDATDLDIYNLERHMTLLDQKIDDGVDTVEAIAHTVDDKITEADASMKAQVAEADAIVEQGKADMTAMVETVEADMAAMAETIEADIENVRGCMYSQILSSSTIDALDVKDGYVYKVPGNTDVIINGITGDVFSGAHFYLLLASGGSGSITINSGTNITVPNGQFVISKEKGRNEALFEFIKVDNSTFRLRQ